MHLIIKCLILLKKFYATLKCVDCFRMTVKSMTSDINCAKPPRESQVQDSSQVRYIPRYDLQQTAVSPRHWR